MKRQQWITLCAALLLVVALFASTKSTLFGEKKRNPSSISSPKTNADNDISSDSIIYYAKKNLPTAQTARLSQLENSITRGNISEQRLHLMHQLAAYWADSAKAFSTMAWYPYAYYTAEAARLENSEKSLSFAAHLFLNSLSSEENQQLKHWEALQAKDLFERSLKLNVGNDSAKVGLGATILYGSLDAPMAGIGRIREVVERDSTNVFAQITLGEASLLSGQLEKAVERFKKVVHLQPQNLSALLLLADTFEKMGRKDEATYWYKKSLPLLPSSQMKIEVEKRITELKTK